MVKERNEIWNTQEEYLNILLKEKNKEKALLKYLGHSVCDLAIIKRKLRALDNLEDIDLYVDELITEKRSLINILKARLNGIKGDKSE